MTVAVVDTGLCNLASIRRSLEECGATVELADGPAALRRAARIVLPGVGTFADGMRALRERGLVDALREEALGNGIPLLGICLGMQLLADRGEEGGDAAGLGLVPGAVRRMVPAAPGERIPHVGWNDVHPVRPHPLFDGIPDGADFYFVHSYRLVPADPADLLAEAPHAGGFAAAVARGAVHGVQFHPEKSQVHGLRLLANFLAL